MLALLVDVILLLDYFPQRFAGECLLLKLLFLVEERLLHVAIEIQLKLMRDFLFNLSFSFDFSHHFHFLIFKEIEWLRVNFCLLLLFLSRLRLSSPHRCLFLGLDKRLLAGNPIWEKVFDLINCGIESEDFEVILILQQQTVHDELNFIPVEDALNVL